MENTLIQHHHVARIHEDISIDFQCFHLLKLHWEHTNNSSDARTDILGGYSCCNEICFNTLKDGGMSFTLKSQTTFLGSRERYLDK
jgi:hypothetical protein